MRWTNERRSIFGRHAGERRGAHVMTLPCTLPATDRASGPKSYAPYLPPVPRPPHDAYTLLLDGRVGWRPLPGKPPVIPAPSIAPLGPDGALMALPLPGSGRALNEP